MVSVSSDKYLQYKNVGGYLMLKLYGEGLISSITLRGNKGEKLAGKATVTMPLGGVPSVTMAEDATTEIKLSCPTPVQLGTTAEESTVFWFVVPPVTFSEGFQITVVGNSGEIVKSTDKTLTIERNNLSKMSPIEVELSQPKNVIYYTSSDGNVITTVSSAVFGANIISNEYADGRGIITFDADVISIGDWAFTGRKKLTGIALPESVTTIGKGAFSSCNSLTSITVPKSVTSIGDFAFNQCLELTSITLPDSVITIGNYAFDGCISLYDIIIPKSVTFIGERAFSGCCFTEITFPESVISIGDFAFFVCNGLTSITIPESVTSIGVGAFAGCASLVHFSGKFASQDGLFLIDSGSILSAANGAMHGSITIPDGITAIGDWSFSFCYGLTSITVPKSVISIGDFAFSSCTDLTNITIPESVTSIGSEAFEGCYGLTSITVLALMAPMGNLRMFNNTNDCPIYVPAGSVDAYKTTEGWSEYADRIQAIPSSIPVPEAVDMGLSVKWASFNLGATKPEEYGDYYAWGELAGKDIDSYTKSNYKFYENGVYTKYTLGGKMVLDPEDDAATVSLGDHWRTPSLEEYLELFNTTKNSVTWTTMNGVVGWTLTSRTNGNSIFIPAGGQRRAENPYDAQGQFAFSWTRDLYPYNDTYAYALCLYDITTGGTYLAPKSYLNETGNLWREMGLPIRPVYAE